MPLPLVINPGDFGHIDDHEEIHALLAPFSGSTFDVAATSQGTLAARPAAGTDGRYYFATDTQVLYYDNGSAWVPIGHRGFSAKVYTLASGSLASGSASGWTPDSESFDYGGFWTSSPQPNRLTIPTNLGGVYQITCDVSFGSNANGYRRVAIMKNGTSAVGTDVRPAANGFPTHCTVIAEDEAIAGDFYTREVEQNSGSSLSLPGGAANNWFSIKLIRLAS